MGLGDSSQPQEAPSGDIFAAAAEAMPVAAAPEVVDEEPSVLSLWQEQRRKTLQERADKEAQQKKEAVAKAQEELQKFYEDREKTINAAKEENAKTEKQPKEEMAAVFKSGSIWEQVAKMVSLTSTEKGGPDRMRSLLIQLKNS